MPPTESQHRGSTDSPSGVVGAIPARFGSSRLPGKVLRTIAGRPMIEHVYDRLSSAGGLDRVVVLTDDERVAEAVVGFGGQVELTPSNCTSGTDRTAFAAASWTGFQAVVNVQGDEPLIDPADVSRLARYLIENPGDPMVTLAAPAKAVSVEDPDVVKVVVDRSGRALYFSRYGIPYPRRQESARHLHHIGIYGYQRDTLLELASLAPTELEMSEGLEQLRALEHGIPIRVLEVATAPIGVDTENDLATVERMFEARD